ncbi:MAG: Hsp20/alpha crystallin family protein [Actinomycetota bacterium]|nr:Hsp20/alpha crystallin family protein [Actinomycetota bacterium]
MSVMHFDRFGDPLRQLDRLSSQLMSGTRTPMGMPMDVWQADDGYHVALDLPGVDPSTVEITSERNVLTIRAERTPEYDDAMNVLVAERPQGTFTRQLQIGDALDVENVQASCNNGVLELTIPVAQSAQPRRIEVRSGQRGQQLGVGSQQQSDEG